MTTLEEQARLIFLAADIQAYHLKFVHAIPGLNGI